MLFTHITESTLWRRCGKEWPSLDWEAYRMLNSAICQLMEGDPPSGAVHELLLAKRRILRHGVLRAALAATSTGFEAAQRVIDLGKVKP